VYSDKKKYFCDNKKHPTRTGELGAIWQVMTDVGDVL
jgi:hypothetical protein